MVRPLGQDRPQRTNLIRRLLDRTTLRATPYRDAVAASVDPSDRLDALTAPIRHQVAGTFRRVLSGGADLPEPADVASWFGDRGDDPGLFGPDSVAWQVHGELATLIGGLRALLLQTLHPLAMAGVAQHSAFREDPFGRLHRTGTFIATTVYGRTPDAERAIASVRRIHERVRGTAPDGRPYAASDPHLVTFVHVTEVDSFLVSHQRYAAARLGPAAADRYVDEMAVICRRLGGEDPPTDAVGVAAWLDAVRPELRLTADARRAVWFLLNPPIPLYARPAYAVATSAAVGLLPTWAQRMLWLPSVPPVDVVAVRPAMRSMLAVLGWALGAAPHKEAARRRTR